MASSQSRAVVQTRILIISDTHGMPLDGKIPQQPVDVAIHCGDLTEESKLEEFHTSLRLLKAIDAPLKLLIPGNHDFTLDDPAFARLINESDSGHLGADLIKAAYGEPGEVRRLFDQAIESGIHLLDEGTHRFNLQNGASLVIYASPYTPSLGNWGFQYRPNQGHLFKIENGTDIAITHGPPHGVLDRTVGRERAGCPDLFAAIARARPLVHCFGHIHEGWGAKLVTWREKTSQKPSHLTDIDQGESPVFEQLSTLRRGTFDTPEAGNAKEDRAIKYSEQRFCGTSHCSDDNNALSPGKQTLFVNAAIKGDEDEQTQLPWLVTLELPKSVRFQGCRQAIKRQLNKNTLNRGVDNAPEEGWSPGLAE